MDTRGPPGTLHQRRAKLSYYRNCGIRLKGTNTRGDKKHVLRKDGYQSKALDIASLKGQIELLQKVWE